MSKKSQQDKKDRAKKGGGQTGGGTKGQDPNITKGQVIPSGM